MQLGQTLALGRLLVPRLNDPQVVGNSNGRKAPTKAVRPANAPSESLEYLIFVTPDLDRAADAPRALHPVPASADESSAESSDAIVPAAFVPGDSDVFGPVIPVLKRRPTRE
jgi:hypothetical protein